MMAATSRLRQLSRNRSGVAIIEFGLALPLFLGFGLTGIEFANYLMANNRIQRLTTMSADLVAQSGTGNVGVSEAQIYDLFNALDLTAQPFNVRDNGRIIITGLLGTDNNNDGKPENRILWQRFDGGYVVPPVVGCARTNTIAILSRPMLINEVTFHVQVTYRYQPIFSTMPFRWLSLPTSFTKIAMFQARNKDFQTPSTDPNFPAKSNCTSVTGL